MSAPPSPADSGLRREGNLIAAIREMTPEQRAELNPDDDEVAGDLTQPSHRCGDEQERAGLVPHRLAEEEVS